jgi:hypothetical protein
MLPVNFHAFEEDKRSGGVALIWPISREGGSNPVRREREVQNRKFRRESARFITEKAI